MSDEPTEGGNVVRFPGGGTEPPWPGTHPLFAAGNQFGLKHGAFSPRILEPLAALTVEQLLDQAAAPGSPIAYLADITYRATVWAWARTEVRVQLIHEWLQERGSELDKDGEALGASRLLNRLEARAESLRARLGLDPLSRARLGRDVALGSVSMAQLMAEEARRLAAEEAGDAEGT